MIRVNERYTFQHRVLTALLRTIKITHTGGKKHGNKESN